MSTRVASRVGRSLRRHGHDRKQLAERPVVEEGLKDGEVAKVLVAEAVFELANLLRDVGLAVKTLHDFEADLPVELFELGLVGQLQQAEREHLVGVLLAFVRVVKGLELVQLRDVLANFEQLLDERVLVLAEGELRAGADFSMAPNTSTISTL